MSGLQFWLPVLNQINSNGIFQKSFSAHCIPEVPRDLEIEQIPLLKQKFNDEGLEYENLSYRDQSRKDNKEEKRNNRNSNKENGYE